MEFGMPSGGPPAYNITTLPTPNHRQGDGALCRNTISGDVHRLVMDSQRVGKGCEVSHGKYGRGHIVDPPSEITTESTEVNVRFYHSGETTEVSIYSLTPASESVTTQTRQGSHGMEVTIDDWFYTLYIEPDQAGSGFEIALRAGNSVIDSAHLDSSDFL